MVLEAQQLITICNKLTGAQDKRQSKLFDLTKISIARNQISQ